MQPFDPDQFKINFPEFATLSNQKLTFVFNTQAITLGQVVIQNLADPIMKFNWLNIVLAHILTVQVNGIMGRLSTAKQGTDALKYDMNTPNGYEWWSSSPYGQQCMQLISTYNAGGNYVWDGQIPYTGNSMNIWGSGYTPWDYKI